VRGGKGEERAYSKGGKEEREERGRKAKGRRKRGRGCD